MSEPLEKVSFKHITDSEEAINYLGEALQSAIGRINELEAKYEVHRHHTVGELNHVHYTTPPHPPIEDTTGEE